MLQNPMRKLCVKQQAVCITLGFFSIESADLAGMVGQHEENHNTKADGEEAFKTEDPW